MKDCLFCKIIKGDIPSFKVYEDDIVIAFLDISPKSNGHTLIVPKKHFHDFESLDDDTILYINKVAKDIIKLLEDKLNITGASITTNYKDLQEIKHYHLHIVPTIHGSLKKVEDIYNVIK